MLTEHHDLSRDDRLQGELDFLFGRINYERTVDVSYPRHFKLESMRRLLSELGDPQEAYEIVHVAGTKGKGSVCRMIGGALVHAGVRTGVYSSPHIETIRERINVDGSPIPASDLARLLGELRTTVLRLDVEAECRGWRKNSFFEIITAAALLYFRQQNVEQVVLEVGLGGRLDSTNVCQPRLCVITNISIDHTLQLGSTVDRIAREKAGIIKRHVPVVSGAIDPLAAREIRESSAVGDSPLIELGRDIEYELLPAEPGELVTRFNTSGRLPDGSTYQMNDVEVNSPGTHQIENAALAIAALHMQGDGPGKVDEAAIRESLRQFSMIGRCEVLARQPFLVVDMAHNVASVEALMTALQSISRSGRDAAKRVLVFGSSRDKDLPGMLRRLVPEFDKVVFTQFVKNPRATDPENLLSCAREVVSNMERSPEMVLAASPDEAWSLGRTDVGLDDLVCVAGSAFLVAEIRPLIREWLEPQQG
ncbi:MAG: bifunctional folylpolyglutamate synthase/dihydrofolate synthase [Pirellulaceae bacterium]